MTATDTDPNKGQTKMIDRSGMAADDPLHPVLDLIEDQLGKRFDERDTDLLGKAKAQTEAVIDERRKAWASIAQNGSVPGAAEAKHKGEGFSFTKLAKGLHYQSKGVSNAMERYCPLEKDITDQARKKFLQTTDDESAGALIPMEIAAGMVEKFRPASVALSLGAREIMPTGVPYKVRRENAFITPDWDGEGVTIDVSPDPSMNFIEGRPRKLTTIVEVTREQLDDAPATDAWIAAQIEREFPIKLDAGILVGDGTGSMPTGLTQVAGANSVNMATATIDPAGGGARVTYDSLKQFQRALRRQNVPDGNAVWIMHPDTFYDIETMVDKIIEPATDTFVNVQQLERRMLGSTPIDRLFGQRIGLSTQMPDGTSGNDRTIIHGDLGVVWVPQWGPFTVTTSEHYRFKEDIILIKPRMRRDVMIVRPEAIVRAINYGT